MFDFYLGLPHICIGKYDGSEADMESKFTVCCLVEGCLVNGCLV